MTDSQAVPSEERFKFCLACGTPASSSGTFCSECGGSLLKTGRSATSQGDPTSSVQGSSPNSQPSADKPSAQRPRKVSRPFVVLAIGVIALIVIGGMLAAFSSSSGGHSQSYKDGYGYGNLAETLTNYKSDHSLQGVNVKGFCQETQQLFPTHEQSTSDWMQGCVDGLNENLYGNTANSGNSGANGANGSSGDTTTTTTPPTTTSTTAAISTSGLPPQEAQFVNDMWAAFPGMQSRMANFYGAYPYTVKMLVSLAQRACFQGEGALGSAGDIPIVTSGSAAQADQNLQLMMSIVTKDLCQ